MIMSLHHYNSLHVVFVCFYAVSFRGQNLLKPRPDWSPLGVKFKISDEHPRLFHMGVPPPGLKLSVVEELGFKSMSQPSCLQSLMLCLEEQNKESD